MGYSSIREIYEAICRAVGKDASSSANGHCPCHQDSTGSLSVTLSQDETKVLLKCFAGCNTADIVRELGFEMSDLFGGDKKKRKYHKSNMTIEQLARAKHLPVEYLKQWGLRDVSDESIGRYVMIPYYDYEKKSVLAERRRIGAKGGDSRWRKGDKPPIYAQWSIERIRGMKYVIFVEGESDTWTLWYHGYPALGLPGASTAKKIQARHVEGVEKIWVFVEPDKGGSTVADSFPCRLEELNWRGALYRVSLEGYKDPNELHKAVRGDKTEFRRLFQAALDAKNLLGDAPSKALYAPERGRALTDMGNGERLALQHGNDMRFVRDWGRWLVWDGNYWSLDRLAEVKKKAKTVVRTIYEEAARSDGKNERKAIVKHAVQSEANGRIEAMIRLCEVEPGISMVPEQFDMHPFLFTVRNGTIDLRTGKLVPSVRDNYITRCAPVTYDPSAKCPQFEEFLHTIFENNANLIQFIQRAIGYSLTGDTGERCLFILHGCGKNGKSTLLDVITALTGEAETGGYGLRTPTETLLVQYGGGGGIPNDIARLKGARFVRASETEEGHRFAEARIKDLTGNEMISARFMRGEFFDFRPEFKLWLGTNHKPVIRGTDNAIWDRIRLIPFNWRVPEGAVDKNFGNKLREEINGIFAWAVRGCLDWQQNGLGTPPEIADAVSEYRAEMDVLADFLEENCVLYPSYYTANTELYQEYRRFCESNSQKMLSHKRFSQRLIERGLVQERTKKERKWLGIGLVKEYDFNQNISDDGDTMTDGDSNSSIVSLPGYAGNVNRETVSPSVTCHPKRLSEFD